MTPMIRSPLQDDPREPDPDGQEEKPKPEPEQ
jgi:hypothetical protein